MDTAQVMDYLYSNTIPGKKRYFLMLDLYDISEREEELTYGEVENIRLFARMLDIPSGHMKLFERFIQEAHREKEAECRSIFRDMEQLGIEISLLELKYYLMTLYDIFECTQQELSQKKELRLVDRCAIRDDLVLKPGMRLVLDHAVVRVYGNIALEGGELIIENSRIVRKGRRHRACVNIRNAGKVVVLHSDIDCRDQGMFIRAQDGEIQVEDSEIYHTTRGAAIRFWGEKMSVRNTYFHHCYSPEDGGAIMVRGGETSICRCQFWHCEAGKGGAIYGRDGMQVRDCSFRKCYASEYGAALFSQQMVSPSLRFHSFPDLCFPDSFSNHLSSPNHPA
jgi:hypothetical protein